MQTAATISPQRAPSTPHTTPQLKRSPQLSVAVDYRAKDGVSAFSLRIASASPSDIVEAERRGEPSVFVKDLADHMAITHARLGAMLGIPRATVARKAAANERLDGQSGLAALGMAKLIGLAQSLVDDSTAPGAPEFDVAKFDVAKWLGKWLEVPQPALGGKAPADFLDTPTGVQMVARLLGALQSGAYQ